MLLVWPTDTTDPVRVEGATDPADVAFVKADGRVVKIGSIDGSNDEIRSRRAYRLGGSSGSSGSITSHSSSVTSPLAISSPYPPTGSVRRI